MMFPVSYDAVKRITEERVARSLTRYRLQHPETVHVTAAVTRREAEVVEVVFAAHCETEQIGA